MLPLTIIIDRLHSDESPLEKVYQDAVSVAMKEVEALFKDRQTKFKFREPTVEYVTIARDA